MPAAQLIFVDTPGIHGGGKRALNRHMNRAAASALPDADLVLFMVEALQWTEQDAKVLRQCIQSGRLVGVVVNKADLLRSRTQLLPYLQNLQNKADFLFIVPVSAKSSDNLDQLGKAIQQHLPESVPLFPIEQITDQSPSLRAAELIREQLMLVLQEEIPYSTAVQIDEYNDAGKVLRVGATIWVEREGQKPIVIGSQGALLKKIGTNARLEIQKISGKKVFLQLWVKVRENWADDERALQQFGVGDT